MSAIREKRSVKIIILRIKIVPLPIEQCYISKNHLTTLYLYNYGPIQPDTSHTKLAEILFLGCLVFSRWDIIWLESNIMRAY